MSRIVIYNPASGDGTGEAFVNENVLPLLEKSGKAADKVFGTTSAGHASILLREYLEAVDGEVTVILAAGDGTLQEIITALSSSPLQGVRAGTPPAKLGFVLVPTGTANALYSSFFPPGTSDIKSPTYRLQSLSSYLSNSVSPSLKHLILGIAIISPAPYVKPRPLPTTSISTVVISTALHASILHDSETEEMRKEYPGIERFKVAAAKNKERWYWSEVKLYGSPELGGVQIYDIKSKKFVPYRLDDTAEEDPDEDQDHDDAIVDLHGPFAYFLSTVNVDRLEPGFRVTPLVTSLPASPTNKVATFDIAVVRPMRDPSLSSASHHLSIDAVQTKQAVEAREKFAAKSMNVLGAVYRDGAHIDLRYDEQGEITTEGDGPSVVEYFRCAGWEWHPDALDDSSHLVCSDGFISRIPVEGRLACSAATPDSATAGLMIHV